MVAAADDDDDDDGGSGGGGDDGDDDSEKMWLQLSSTIAMSRGLCWFTAIGPLAIPTGQMTT